ncbi:MAG: helix-turn-helix domain-containing protein [Bryobacteraceae bacterium]
MNALTTDAPKPIMSLAEVAEMLGISRGKVYDAVRKAELPHRRLGGRILFPRRAIETWLETAVPGSSA